MIFKDREEGGKKLTLHLQKYMNDPQAIVIGLPRGGIVTAYIVAKSLHLPLDIVYPRKIGAPFNPELAIGAITESGEGFFNEKLITEFHISQEYLKQTVEHEKSVANQRLARYRQFQVKIPLKGKTVLLIDDGIATGSTMHAAIQSVKAEGAHQIVVAIPVGPPDTIERISKEVDEVICLSTPPYFAAVGQFYQNFSQVEDEEVIKLLSLGHRT